MVVILGLSACKKDNNNVSQASLLQNKWLIVEDSTHYDDYPAGDSVYLGTANDFYQFSADSLHMQYGGANGYNFTTTYQLVNDSTIILPPALDQNYLILNLTSNALKLSTPVSAFFINTGDHYSGIRIISFRR
jgi:hypothetical protein